MRYKFILILCGVDGWIVVFELSFLEFIEEIYIFGIKVGNNYIFIVIYDRDLKFFDVEILLINWVVVDVKVFCFVGVRLCDIDF